MICPGTELPQGKGIWVIPQWFVWWWRKLCIWWGTILILFFFFFFFNKFFHCFRFQLRGVISYLKWVHVHLCFNGELAPLLNNPFKYLHVQFEQLLGALPSPGVPLEDNFGVGMIKKYRLDLTLERSTFNRTLIFDRDSLKKPPPSKEERQESVLLRRVVEAQLLAHYCRP